MCDEAVAQVTKQLVYTYGVLVHVRVDPTIKRKSGPSAISAGVDSHLWRIAGQERWHGAKQRGSHFTKMVVATISSILPDCGEPDEVKYLDAQECEDYEGEIGYDDGGRAMIVKKIKFEKVDESQPCPCCHQS